MRERMEGQEDVCPSRLRVRGCQGAGREVGWEAACREHAGDTALCSYLALSSGGRHGVVSRTESEEWVRPGTNAERVRL